MQLLTIHYMNFIKKNFIVVIGIMAAVILLLTSVKKAEAANSSDTKSQKGMIIFTTTDTKANSGIRWKTIGFTVTRDKCLSGTSYNGGYPTKMKHGTIWLDNKNKREIDLGNGKVEVTFIIPKETVSKALINSGMKDIGDNEILYLHGIFQVTHNGKDFGTKKYDLPSIIGAEPWADIKDFKDHFDIKIVYAGDVEPIYIEYRTKAGQIISTATLSESQWVKSGAKVNVNLDKYAKFNDKTYTICQSFYMYMNEKSKKLGIKSLEGNDYGSIQKRSVIQNLKGVKFVAVMSPPAERVKAGEVTGDLAEPDLKGEIGAEEVFDVEQGIPSGESVYVNILGSQYLTKYSFIQKNGTKIYPLTIKKKYNLIWEDDSGEIQKDYKTITETISVEREYSYWEIKELNIYTIESGEIRNSSLPYGKINLISKTLDIPAILYNHSASITSHITDPVYSETIFLNQTIYQKNIPLENFQSIAEASVGQIKVNNDLLIFNNITIMDNKKKERAANKPLRIPACEKMCGADIMFSDNNVIPYKIPNGEYESSGKITYKKIVSVNSKSANQIVYEIPNINSVVVHTPVVCDATVENKKSFNQMISPDKTMAGLILDTKFNVCFPSTGYHRNIPGYGYKDYGKYIYKKQIKFPFDVYYKNQYICKNTWSVFLGDIQEYYLPTWVDEGKYQIDFKAISINASEKDLRYNSENHIANLDIESYIAVDSVWVELSGRIYGLNIYDISDYPLWKNVFRKNNSMELTKVVYKVGINNQNGVCYSEKKDNYTLPIINGSHPVYRDKGALKAGYMTRFSLITVGNMNTESDYIKITPSFYYIDYEGKNRQEVDIYYTETINGVKSNLVKAGGEEDKKNKKKIVTGDKYLSIPQSELLNVMLIDGINKEKLYSKERNIYTFKNIMIPESLRTYIGSENVSSNVSKNKAVSSVQKWYCEYYLPGNIYAVPKDYDVYGVTRRDGLTYREKFWLKDGYIIVNFEIETIKNGKRHLSYINKENYNQGYCNMWQKEGFLYEKKDFSENKYNFKDGDYVLYYTDKSVKNDYIEGGTH